MRPSKLIFTLLMSFETPVPGVDLRGVRISGYSTKAIQSAINDMHEDGLIDILVAHDAAGIRYAGVVVGLTDLGKALLRVMRGESRRRVSARARAGEIAAEQPVAVSVDLAA